MKKRILSILLTLCMMLTLLPTVALADEGAPALDTDWFYNAAAGTTEYTISTAAELRGLAQLVFNGDDFPGKTVKLGADIDLSSIANWTPIGNGERSGSTYKTYAFKGTFDGNGKTISNLKITANVSDTDANKAFGLFGVVDGGTVKNLTLKDVAISGNGDNVGAAIGLMVNNATAEKITVSGSVEGADGVGGIVGRMTIEGTISGCTNNAKVSSAKKAGGIVGAAYYTAENKTMTISGCYNDGNVTSDAGYVGGIAGLSAAKVSGCENSGDITGNGTSIGGIVGEQANYGSVIGCNNSGDVKNNKTDKSAFGTGGIVGWVRYPNESSDYPLKAVIEVKNNTNSGTITGGWDAGGIVGVVFHAANVTGNENTATSMSTYNFAGGIVGSFQNKETLKQGESGNEIPHEQLNCSNNVSTTTLDQMTGTGTCKSLYVYDNVGESNTGKIENNSAAWEAQIGDTKYATLAAAVSAAANGQTVTLLGNVTLTSALTIPAYKTLTLDLNGKNITAESSHAIDNSGNLAIQGSGTVSATGTKHAAIVNRVGATATVNGGTYQTGKAGKDTDWYVIKNFGTMTIGGTVTVKKADGAIDASSLIANGWSNGSTTYAEGNTNNDDLGVTHTGTTRATLTINSGSFNGESGAKSCSVVKNDDYGTLTITGGDFNSTNSTNKGNDNTTILNWGIATIEGGTFKGAHPITNGASTYVGGESQFTIKDGTFESTDNRLLGKVGSVGQSTGILTIEGGNFTASTIVTEESQSSWYNVSVTGGTFSTDPNTYAADGYTSYQNPDGTFGVVLGSSSDKADVTITVTPDGATVELKQGDTVVGTAAGTYTNLPSGTYTLTVSKGGYQTATQTITVAGENQTVTVSLSPVSTSSGVSRYDITVKEYANGSVTASAKRAAKGTTITLTVAPESGYTLETLTVLDKNGNALDLTDKGSGKYSFKMPAGKVEVKATFMDDNTMLNFFVDVPASAYYYDAVLWAAKNEITGGIDATHFGPDLTCTRAQLVTFLWRAAGCPVVNYAMSFTDVDESEWYGEAVRWAASLGIVGGYGNGLFGTNDEVLREQVVTILYRYAVAMGMDTAQGGMAVREYSDYDSISDYALSAMQWAVNAGIVNGSDGKLMPQDSCTRGQIVTMLYRLLGK